MTSTPRRYFWPALAACAAVAGLILAFMPAEKTIGQVIKIVYLHGALSRAGMAGFAAAGMAGLGCLAIARAHVLSKKWGAGLGVALARWTQALLWAGWLFWVTHFLVSMPATHLTWGPWIAWGEPRVTMTLQVAAAGLAVILIGWLIGNNYFAAGANLLFAVAFVILAERTGVLRHPLDPIGTSPSLAFKLIYAALLIPVIAAMFLVAWRLSAGSAPTRSMPLEARYEDR